MLTNQKFIKTAENFWKYLNKFDGKQTEQSEPKALASERSKRISREAARLLTSFGRMARHTHYITLTESAVCFKLNLTLHIKHVN